MKTIILITIALIYSGASAQTITSHVPASLDKSNKYVFYLHGRIVQEQGVNAVSPEYGPYEYQQILDTLKSYGFNIISERRPKGTDAMTYAAIVAKQVDTLLSRGIAPENIVVVGASMGSGIASTVAATVKNRKINYAFLAMCSEELFTYYGENKLELCGNFLSIYESSDALGSCDKLLMNQSCKSGYREIRLSMNNRHGFIYKPYPEWIHPLVNWIKGE